MDYEQKCKEYLERAKEQLNGAKVFDYDNEQIAHAIRTTVYSIFPGLKESEGERIRKWCISHFRECFRVTKDNVEYKEYLNNKVIPWLKKQGQTFTKKDIDDAYLKGVCDTKQELEKQGEQNHCMIQWKGDNLKEVIDFTGKDKNFEKWFKSFEEYEKYVQEHDGIFKLFNADGSHYEVPVGAWIVKTPDGYNVASKAIFRQKPADKCEGCNNAKGCVTCVDGSEWAHIEEHNPAWGNEDEEMLRRCISATFDHGYLRECDWLKSLKDRVGCEVKRTTTKEWSVEDEINYNYALAACKYYGEAKGYADTETHQKANNWLKSLKKRIGNFDKGFNVGFSAAKYNQWEPNDEQIKILSIYAAQNNYHGTVLTSLYKDLKKLKGE